MNNTTSFETANAVLGKLNETDLAEAAAVAVAFGVAVTIAYYIALWVFYNCLITLLMLGVNFTVAQVIGLIAAAGVATPIAQTAGVMTAEAIRDGISFIRRFTRK